jgi:phosphoglucomutase
MQLVIVWYTAMWRIMLLQGTGSAGATIRLYVEQFESDASKHSFDAPTALKPLIGYYLLILHEIFTFIFS